MFRLLVEKNKPFNFEERDMKNEIISFLGIKNLTDVKIYNGYDIEEISQEAFEISKWKVFAEKGINTLVDENDLPKSENQFTVEFLPGQYDQRADYSIQLIKIFSSENPFVKTFKHYVFFGNISPEDLQIIKKYYINPVESREITFQKPKTILPSYDKPSKIIHIENFISLTENELQELKSKFQISMSVANLKFCQEHYKNKNSIPTITELKIFDTYWSDHCRHSTFLTEIEDVTISDSKESKILKDTFKIFNETKTFVYENEDRPLCLMDIATLEMKKLKKLGLLDDLEKSDEINACSIEAKIKIDDKDEDYIIMFKNETHNHPTEIEPFGGASTCLGGGIRDPLSGRAFVFGAMRVTGASNPNEDFENTLQGKLPQRKITKTAADGYSSYGNQIGLASGYLTEIYDDGFKAKRLELGALVAAIPKRNIRRENAKCGDVIVLVGGRTGRDGLGGATGSSTEQDEKVVEKNFSEVQKGNPIIERNIVRLFRNPNVSKLIKKCNDFGAGGVSVAIGELAESLEINLDQVLTKYPGLDATELSISESQERMAVLLDKNDLALFLKYAQEENLDAVCVAKVTNNKRIFIKFEDKIAADIDSEFLNSGGLRQKTSLETEVPKFDLEITKINFTKDNFLNNLKNLNVCSKKGISNGFDSSSENVSVFSPFGGKYKKTPELGLAMKIPVESGKTDTGVLMTLGYNSDYCNISPFHAAYYAVLESILKIVAMGGDYKKIRLSFQEYFESLGTNKKSWGKAFSSLIGAFLAQEQFSIPSIGGKDSMSGTYKDINVPPSLFSFAVSVIDTKKIVSRSFKSSDSFVVLVESEINENNLPNIENLKNNLNEVCKLIQEDKVNSSTTIGFGGIAAAISEMTFGNNIGFSFNKDFDADLFNPNYSSIILEVENLECLENLSYKLIGNTTTSNTIDFKNISVLIDEAFDVWKSPLEEIFPTKNFASEEINLSTKFSNWTPNKILNEKSKVPTVLIPIFPGSTGEYTLEKQFKNAGAIVKTFLFKNKSKDETEKSFEKLFSEINNSDVVAIPNGMSAGSEPDGVAKLIHIIFSEGKIKNSINELLERGGLVFGLGEGFKALLKLGLIQNGKIVDNSNENIFAVRNFGNRYFSGIVNVKINNTKNIWYDSEIEIVETVPVSGIDCAIKISKEDFEKYFENGQIIGQYADWNNNASMDSEFNPFGSYYAVESLMSKNGQVLGKIGLIDRLEEGLYKNVFDAKESNVFKNIVNHFKFQGEVTKNAK